MKISVITPVLNEPRVTRALDSIFSQSHEHQTEVIVVDGGSTDGTLEALEGYRDRISTLISEPDDGMYDAMNKGIRHATGDVVAILNADDEYTDPSVLRDVMATFADEETDACYGDLIFVDDEGQDVLYWNAAIVKWSQGKIMPHWVPPHPTFFVRRSVYERCGVFRLDIPVAADTELLLRLIYKRAIRLKHIDRALARFSVGGRSDVFRHGRIKPHPEILRVWQVHYKYRWLWFLFTFPLYQIVIAPMWSRIRRLKAKRRLNDA